MEVKDSLSKCNVERKNWSPSLNYPNNWPTKEKGGPYLASNDYPIKQGERK